MKPLLSLESITKTFPGITALDAVSLDVRPGEILTLLGENGAGKSTLMNVLAGLYAPDSGTIRIDGAVANLSSPSDSFDHGIGMVHQHFMLVSNHTVLENLLLALPGRPFMARPSTLRNRVKTILDEFNLSIDLDEPIWKLSIGQQQWVEIIKLLLRDCRLLIFDEPTAVLTPQEADTLFGFIRKLREGGRAIIFISHKMREVMELSDRVTILKKGKVVDTVTAGAFDESRLARLMIGDDAIPEWEKTPKEFSETLLSMQGVSVKNDKGLADLIDFNLDMLEGEVLGIAGVAGNGQKALAEVLTGLVRPEGGRMFVRDEDITMTAGRRGYIAGIAHIPEDRKAMGIAPDMTVDENLVLKTYKEKEFRKFAFLDFAAIRINAERQVERFAIKTGPAGSPVRLLSGGNIQKVIIARELSLKPLILVALYPTRGLDIGSAEYVHKIIVDAREKGMSTLLISEDLDELLKLSDRIAVMFRGRITGIVDPAETSREELGLMMSGMDAT